MSTQPAEPRGSVTALPAQGRFMSDHAFDPSRYLTKVGSSDYLEVKWRLVWLRELHPDASVETELVHFASPLPHPETGEIAAYAVFKATITIPGGGNATGFAHETMVDFREFLEKAETKAIGRALAALGFGTQFCSDFDFSGGSGKPADVPVDISRTRGAQRARQEPVAMITKAQIDRLAQLKTQKGATDEGIKKLHGKPSASQLTQAEAAELIKTLEGFPDIDLTR